MRKFRLVSDTQKYQKLLDGSAKTPLPPDFAANFKQLMSNADLTQTPSDAFILTGMKTPKYGGGPSPYGFVISAGKVVGRIKLTDDGRLSGADWLTAN